MKPKETVEKMAKELVEMGYEIEDQSPYTISLRLKEEEK